VPNKLPVATISPLKLPLNEPVAERSRRLDGLLVVPIFSREVIPIKEAYSSVHAPFGEYPPKASAAFCVPAPAKLFLAVIKAPPAVHEVPLYSSVHDNSPPEYPPKARPAF